MKAVEMESFEPRVLRESEGVINLHHNESSIVCSGTARASEPSVDPKFKMALSAETPRKNPWKWSESHHRSMVFAGHGHRNSRPCTLHGTMMMSGRVQCTSFSLSLSLPFLFAAHPKHPVKSTKTPSSFKIPARCAALSHCAHQ